MSKELEALKRMHWLTEQVLAKDNPITLEQIEKFGKNPNVMIPDHAVELRRLPDQHLNLNVVAVVPHRDDIAYQVLVDGPNSLRHLICSPHGTFVVDGGFTDLIGFIGNVPLYLQHYDEKYALNLGDAVLFHTSRNVSLVRKLRDDSIVIVCGDKVCSQVLRIMKPGEPAQVVIERTRNHYIDFHMGINTDEIFAVWLESRMGRCYGSLHETFFSSSPQSLLTYTRICIQGETKAFVASDRHGQVCWVIGHDRHPAFHRVSHLFEHSKHGLCYLGLMGNHIVTMQVPVLTTFGIAQ